MLGAPPGDVTYPGAPPGDRAPPSLRSTGIAPGSHSLRSFVIKQGYYAHFDAILVLLGAFLDFCWRILGFFCIFLGYVFLGHTSDNVAARAKNIVLSGFFGRFTGLLCSFSCHFGSFEGIFGLFLAYFGIFLPFFLVKFFFVKRPIMWLRGQKKCSFRTFLSFQGLLCSFSCHLGSFGGILDFFWRILGFFCLFSWLSFSSSNVL